MSVVYFLQAGEGGPVKIGFTKSLEARIRELQTGCPYELRVLATIAGKSRLERRYHYHLWQHRLRAEWFNPSEAVLHAAARAAAGEVVAPPFEPRPVRETKSLPSNGCCTPKKGGSVCICKMVADMGGMTKAAQVFGVRHTTVQHWLKAGVPWYRANHVTEIGNGFLAGRKVALERAAA
jgi:hypothetical protein